MSPQRRRKLAALDTLTQNEIKALRGERELAESRLKTAREALEFYAHSEQGQFRDLAVVALAAIDAPAQKGPDA